MKGRRLQIKGLSYFLSETPFALYNIYNQGHWPSIIRELTTILGKARDSARKDNNLEEEYEAQPFPPMTFCKNFPKLPGQVTSQLNNWPWKIQVNRRVLHLEVDKGETKFIEKIIEFAKEKKYFEEMWGKQVHVSKVVGKDTSAVEIKHLINVSQKHTNFHSSMTAEELVGIIDFDVTETVYSVLDPTKVVATMNISHVL